MNERIKELAEQAQKIVGYLDGGYTEIKELDQEKFAELIVRQCIGMVLPYNEEDPCAERLYELADTIGEHFGVEG